jgi:hypothetical protein
MLGTRRSSDFFFFSGIGMLASTECHVWGGTTKFASVSGTLHGWKVIYAVFLVNCMLTSTCHMRSDMGLSTCHVILVVQKISNQSLCNFKFLDWGAQGLITYWVQGTAALLGVPPPFPWWIPGFFLRLPLPSLLRGPRTVVLLLTSVHRGALPSSLSAPWWLWLSPLCFQLSPFTQLAAFHRVPSYKSTLFLLWEARNLSPHWAAPRTVSSETMSLLLSATLNTTLYSEENRQQANH